MHLLLPSPYEERVAGGLGPCLYLEDPSLELRHIYCIAIHRSEGGGREDDAPSGDDMLSPIDGDHGRVRREALASSANHARQFVESLREAGVVCFPQHLGLNP